MLLTTRVLVSCVWPEGHDGRYYWEHCVYVDSDDFDNNTQMFLAILADMKLLYTSQVQFHSMRWFDPSDGSLVHQQGIASGNVGLIAPVESPNLLICGRWRMYGVDGSYSYHLHRMPVGSDMITGGEWSEDGLTAMQTRMNTFIAQDIYRTHTGSLIDVGEVAGSPVMWQLRHGTKRKASNFWL